MGRKKMIPDDRKVKFGISLDKNIFNRMTNDKIMKSRLIETLLKEYYGNKNL